MTTYLNNRFVDHVKEWIRDKEWYKGVVVGRAGIFPLGNISRNQKTIQMDKLYALGATIKKSDEKEFPAAVVTEMESLERKLKWFNGIVEWTEEEHEDYLAGDDFEVRNTEVKIDNVAYQYDKDIETWFSGYGTTFTSDPDYDERWVPWLKAATTASSTASACGDMNDKVTNIAGTTGTTATILDMTTILTSTTTNMTIDFVQKTFQPIMDAFCDFEDSNTGRRMVDSQSGNLADATFQLHVAPKLARAFKYCKVYDGERITNLTIAQDLAANGIEIVPNRSFTASLQEDGTCQFGFTANFAENFKIGIANKMSWEADREIIGVKSKWVKRMTSRLVPFTMPYFDGSNWYKAFFHGSFVYKNDAA